MRLCFSSTYQRVIFRVKDDQVQLFAGVPYAEDEVMGATLLETSFGPGLARVVRLGDDLFLLSGSTVYKVSGSGIPSVLVHLEDCVHDVLLVESLVALPALNKLLLLLRQYPVALFVLVDAEDGSYELWTWPDEVVVLGESTKIVVPWEQELLTITHVELASELEPENLILVLASQRKIFRRDMRGLYPSTFLVLCPRLSFITAFEYNSELDLAAYSLREYSTAKDEVRISLLARYPTIPIDHTSLASNPSLLIPATRTFKHAASGTLFHVHEQILKVRGLPDTVLELLASAPHAPEVIQAIVLSLYGNDHTLECTLRGAFDLEACRYDKDATVDSRWELLVEIARLTNLLHECKIPAASQFEKMFQTGICSFQPTSDLLFSLLVFVWKECRKNERLMLYILDELRRRHPFIFQEKAAEVFALGSEDPVLWMQLISKHYDQQYDCVPGEVLITDQIARGLRKIAPLRWRTSVPPSERPLDSYCFCIEGVTGYTESWDWLLFPQWPFFNALMSSELNESLTRIVTLPSHFPKNVLLNILAACHRTHAPSLGIEDSIYILTHAEQFGLHDPNATKPRFLSHFDSLHIEAQHNFRVWINRPHPNGWAEEKQAFEALGSPFISECLSLHLPNHGPPENPC